MCSMDVGGKPCHCYSLGAGRCWFRWMKEGRNMGLGSSWLVLEFSCLVGVLGGINDCYVSLAGVKCGMFGSGLRGNLRVKSMGRDQIFLEFETHEVEDVLFRGDKAFEGWELTLKKMGSQNRLLKETRGGGEGVVGLGNWFGTSHVG